MFSKTKFNDSTKISNMGRHCIIFLIAVNRTTSFPCHDSIRIALSSHLKPNSLPIFPNVHSRPTFLLIGKPSCRLFGRGLTRTGKQMASFRIAIFRRSHCPVCFVCEVRYFTDENQNRRDSERTKGITWSYPEFGGFPESSGLSWKYGFVVSDLN